jgi:hypothetical protein
MPAVAPDPLGPQHRDQPVVLADLGRQRLGRLLSVGLAGLSPVCLDLGEAGQRSRQAHADLHREASKCYPVKRLNRYTVTGPNPST